MAQPRPAHGWKNSIRQLKKKRNRKTVLTVAAAFIVIVTFICKEVVVGELKEWSDSIQAARAAVNTQRNVSDISLQIMASSEVSELDQAKDVAASHDYSAIILRGTFLARQALANLNDDFESTSHLVDKLLFLDVYGNWRQMRDKARELVDKTNKDVNSFLTPSPKNDLNGMARAKAAFIEPLAAELLVIVLESSVMTATKKVQDAIDWVRRFFTRMSYFFYVIGVSLALYANPPHQLDGIVNRIPIRGLTCR
jgi:hypothetical protein